MFLFRIHSLVVPAWLLLVAFAQGQIQLPVSVQPATQNNCFVTMYGYCGTFGQNWYVDDGEAVFGTADYYHALDNISGSVSNSDGAAELDVWAAAFATSFTSSYLTQYVTASVNVTNEANLLAGQYAYSQWWSSIAAVGYYDIEANSDYPSAGTTTGSATLHTT